MRASVRYLAALAGPDETQPALRPARSPFSAAGRTPAPSPADSGWPADSGSPAWPAGLGWPGGPLAGGVSSGERPGALDATAAGASPAETGPASSADARPAVGPSTGPARMGQGAPSGPAWSSPSPAATPAPAPVADDRPGPGSPGPLAGTRAADAAPAGAPVAPALLSAAPAPRDQHQATSDGPGGPAGLTPGSVDGPPPAAEPLTRAATSWADPVWGLPAHLPPALVPPDPAPAGAGPVPVPPIGPGRRGPAERPTLSIGTIEVTVEPPAAPASPGTPGPAPLPGTWTRPPSLLAGAAAGRMRYGLRRWHGTAQG